MSIKAKIMLLGLIPLVALLYILQDIIRDGLQRKEYLRTVYFRVQEAERISNLVHELQKERGITSGVLAQKGEKNFDGLMNQRAETDKRVYELQLLEEERGTDGDLLKIIAALPEKRNEISSFSISAVAAEEYYTAIIRDYLDKISAIAVVAVIAERKDRLTAHSYLLYAKEFLGQMRAVLNRVLTRGTLDGDTLRDLASKRGVYEFATRNFLTSAQKDVRRFYINTFKGKDVEATMQILASVFEESPRRPLPSPHVWFAVASASMDLLKQVEDYSMGRIKQNTAEDIVSTTRTVDRDTAIIVSLITLIVAFIFLNIRTILFSFSILLSTITAIIKTRDFKQRIPVRSRDEVGTLSESFNVLLGTVQGLIEEKERLATTDALTGIFNRRKFDELLGLEVERAGRYKTQLSLILFDIDDFKRINDLYGHAVGDYVLIQTAALVRASVRAADIFARWGGEEFSILALETDLSGTLELAEKVRSAIGSYKFSQVGTMTCSFGVTEYREGDTADTLIKRADDALYTSKGGGKNRVSFS